MQKKLEKFLAFLGQCAVGRKQLGRALWLANKTCHGETNSINVIPGIIMLVLWLVLLNKLIK